MTNIGKLGCLKTLGDSFKSKALLQKDIEGESYSLKILKFGEENILIAKSERRFFKSSTSAKRTIIS
jgi:hypothetical protein